MIKFGYYLLMSMRGKKSSSRHFVTIFTIGLFIFFSTQMISAWIIKLTEEDIHADVETNRTIRWQFEETLQEQLITEAQVKSSISELQNHPDIEQVLFDHENLNSAVIIIKDYKDLLTLAMFIESNYFGGTAVSGSHFASLNMMTGVQISTRIMNRLTQVISLLTYATLVSKYLDKRKNEMYRLWVVGCTDIQNRMFLFTGTLIFLTTALLINLLLCVLTVSCIIYFFISQAHTMITTLQISLNIFFSLTPYMVFLVLVNAWISFWKGKRLINSFRF